MHRTKTTIRITLPVEVEVEVDYDPRAKQANILAAKVSESRNKLTPRKVYSHMKHGDYNLLDSSAFNQAHQDFMDAAFQYRDKPTKDLPEGEIRCPPMIPISWAKTMKNIRGTHLRIPINLVLDSLKHKKLEVVIEPVLSKTPTMYVWHSDISDSVDKKDVLSEMINQMKSSVKAENIEEHENGSWKVTWRRV